MALVLDDEAMRKEAEADSSNTACVDVPYGDHTTHDVRMVQIHSKTALDVDHAQDDSSDHGSVQDANQILYTQATNGSRGSPERIYHNYTD